MTTDINVPQEYVQYHNSEAMGVSCLDLSDGKSDGFSIATNKPVSAIKGSRIWLIGGLGYPRKYYLCYYFFADTIESLGKYSGFKFRVTGKQGIALKPAKLISDFPWFKEFLKSQQNFSLGLRTIDQRFVEELEKVVSNQEVQNSNVDEPVKEIGAGFGNPETNRKVENAAISCVTSDYEKRGWSVKSVESEKIGFDLLCTKDGIQEHVEVKGIQGSLLSFIITIREVRRSKQDENFVLCVVTSALSNPSLHRFTAQEFDEQFALETIAYRASLKKK